MTQDIEGKRAILEEKIANGEVIKIEMGTAYNWEMEEIPWIATVIPESIVTTKNGPALRCRVDTGNDYMIVGGSQVQGGRIIALCKFRIV